MTTGRNDPCPCGSGRKFKHCCLRTLEAEDAARTRLRAAEGVLVPSLFAYAVEELGPEFFAEAWSEFFLWNDVREEPDESKEFGTTFDPFLAFSFVPDAAERELPAGWPVEPLARHFLRREVESCPDFHREFIDQACKSPASFFLVEAVTPGRRIDLKDVLTGRRFRVLEQSASRTLRPGDLSFSRIVTVGDSSILIGACPWVIPPSWQIPIIDLRERLGRGRMLTREELVVWNIEVRGCYLEIADALQNPRLPVLQNTDGDPIELTTITYDLSVPVADAVERLRPLATLGGAVHIHDEAYDAAGEMSAATLTWIKTGNRQHKDWDNTSLGTLRLQRARLVVEVNSARRRRRIEREIRKRLGAAARPVDTTVTDLVQELAKRRAEREERGGSEGSEPPERETPPELQAVGAELARKHWAAWVDTKIPALGGRTPRQAAKTAAGRERLEALLADFERSAERNPSAFAPDIASLQERLRLG